jgi:hypothetical protein
LQYTNTCLIEQLIFAVSIGAWWEVDLGKDVIVARVAIYNRIDGDGAHALNVSSRLSNSRVSLRNLQGNILKAYEIQNATGIPVFDISFDSYLGETEEPTQSPTVFTPCAGMEVEIKVETDSNPNEIAWTLVNKCGVENTLRSPLYSLSNKMQSTTACLPIGMYQFSITDTFGDGLCCTSGRGSYEIRVNGALVHTGGKYFKLETKTFGACPIVDSYLGCYIDLIESKRTLPYFAGHFDKNGRTNCVQACFSIGYQYAGTQNATECWCGNSYQTHNVDHNGNECNMPCRGTAAEMCGGPRHISVYDIKATLVYKVRVELEGLNHLHMREVQVFDQNNINRALNKNATQSSTAVDCGADNQASSAVNGDLMDMSHTLFEPCK